MISWRARGDFGHQRTMFKVLMFWTCYGWWQGRYCGQNKIFVISLPRFSGMCLNMFFPPAGMARSNVGHCPVWRPFGPSYLNEGVLRTFLAGFLRRWLPRTAATSPSNAKPSERNYSRSFEKLLGTYFFVSFNSLSTFLHGWRRPEAGATHRKWSSEPQNVEHVCRSSVGFKIYFDYFGPFEGLWTYLEPTFKLPGKTNLIHVLI